MPDGAWVATAPHADPGGSKALLKQPLLGPSSPSNGQMELLPLVAVPEERVLGHQLDQGPERSPLVKPLQPRSSRHDLPLKGLDGDLKAPTNGVQIMDKRLDGSA
eukprot:2756448-Alexandrium_andersonii.AAC.1